jgi:hypothetical protein
MDFKWGQRGRPVVSFDSAEEALRFVVEWRFGYSGGGRYNFAVFQKWGLPRPSSAPDNIDLDRAIEAGIMRVLGEDPGGG